MGLVAHIGFCLILFVLGYATADILAVWRQTRKQARDAHDSQANEDHSSKDLSSIK